MIKYAIISDIHGNLEALNVVIDDIKKRKIDRVICLGDIVSKGSHSHECLEKVRGIADAIVAGNKELWFSKSLDEITLEAKDFDFDRFYVEQKQLTSDDIAFLRTLPLVCEFYLSGNLIRCFHSTPNFADNTIYEFYSYVEKHKLFAPTEYTTNSFADIVVQGHTHCCSMSKFFGRTLINVGSVGNSLNLIDNEKLNNANVNEITSAHYVIITGEDGKKECNISFEFVSLNYDKNKEIESYKLDFDKEEYRNELETGKYRHSERVKKKLIDRGHYF